MARPRSDIAERIVLSARQRFLMEGVDGASLRAIAQDAKTNIGMVYYYFPTKDDLFLAVVEQVYVKLLSDLSVAFSPDITVQERIQGMYARLGDLSDEEFTVVRIVIREALVSSSRLGKLVERFSRGHLPLLLNTLAEGQQEGSLDAQKPLPALLVSLMALGAMPQIVLRLVQRAGIATPIPHVHGQAVAEQMYSILLYGIAAKNDGPSAARDSLATKRPRNGKKRL